MSAVTAWRPGPPRGCEHPLGAREPAVGSLHEQNELAHIGRQVHNELIELVRRGWQAMSEPIHVPGSQTFAEATSGVPDTVNQVADAVGVSMADAARSLEEFGRAWRASLARDQRER